MIQRYLAKAVENFALERGKMAFVSGPRQVGKTTFARALKRGHSIYKNWDETQFRRLWTRDPNKIMNEFDLTRSGTKRFIILDEIHKARGWKQKVKGLYDEYGSEVEIMVTGSARLNIFKKGGDSLMGRYLQFRLHPFSYGELIGRRLEPDSWRASLMSPPRSKIHQAVLERLLNFSGFPEPYLAHDRRLLNIWRQGRNEKIVREDLRDLSRLPELSQVEMLTSLLPEKVGSPLSVQSLREDLEVSFDTVKRWLLYLRELYFYFEVKPWTQSIARSLKKEPKIYLYDATEIENPGSRFENLVALHLHKACHFWTDTGEGKFELFYLRNKEKQEIDFLIAKNQKPWLAVEAKLNDTKIDTKSFKKFQSTLKIPFAQVVMNPGHFRAEQDQVVMSAGWFLEGLP